MNRRGFIKAGTASLTLPFWLDSCFPTNASFPITVHSDHQTGHLLMASATWPERKQASIDVAIVGGGVAGLTAAYQKRETNYQIFELSSDIGGSSGATSFDGIRFSQGAHYDLAYPEQYGDDVLRILRELDIIRYEAWRNMWGFVDQQHVIPYQRKEHCYDHGVFRKEVMTESRAKDEFETLAASFSGKLNLPTRLIDPSLHHLNDVSFASYLSAEIQLTADFEQLLDYHMYDDYGGCASQVSALAGLAYFACRPYYSQLVDLFSPPNGNDYFIQKIASKLDTTRLKTNHLVSRIEPDGQGFVVKVLDVKSKQIVSYSAQQIIYAGQKHALKYIFPEQACLFKNSYAPWMVVNVITRQPAGKYGYWQNEYLGENPQFLGFVDSSVQDQGSLNGYRIFTGYYCLKEEDRNHLTTIEENKEKIAHETISYLQNMLKHKVKPEACFIKVMGHAMPIPKPGYLFNDANYSEKAMIRYAGVDNGRLPLLFEALDSGIEAARF